MKNRTAMIALGKALFWDMQAGTDGIQSCATCHFNAGADSRSKNQISPGINAGDNTFTAPLAGGFSGGPNYQLHVTDFPFHSGPQNQTAVGDTNDVVSSQGVDRTTFLGVVPAQSYDQTTPATDAAFNVGGVTTRRVEPRNTPTVINAVFNYRNFWDGRAQAECNGVNPFGVRDPNAHLYRASSPTATPQSTHVIVKAPASTCSQALGPPLSAFEMSAGGRDFKALGRKLVTAKPLNGGGNPLTPLGNQLVDPTDSYLGSFSKSPFKGLKTSYMAMIQSAFDPVWWQETANLICVGVDGQGGTHDLANVPNTAAGQTQCSSTLFNQFAGSFSPNLTSAIAYSQIEYNFSLFWGISIMVYESILRADQTPVDIYFQQLNAPGSTQTFTSATGANFSGTLSAIPLRPGSITVTDASGTVNGTDDGNGNLTGADIATGTVNYSTGAISANFTTALLAGAQLTVSYKKKPTALNAVQLVGLDVFQNKGKCIACHSGPELTNASVANVSNEPLERMTMGNNGIAVYDDGFYNIGVRPTAEDLGIGGSDPFGNPLSATAVCQQSPSLCQALGFKFPPFVPARPGENIPGDFLSPNERIAVMGSFKAPALRNVELTAPYWHNGGFLTLGQVVDFYNRGGDFPQTNEDNLDPDIQPLNLTDDEKQGLVAFLLALTDPRVKFQQAPFDHPQLFVPNGSVCTSGGPSCGANAPVNSTTATVGGVTFGPVAVDDMVTIPAVGKKGSATPLPTFREGLINP